MNKYCLSKYQSSRYLRDFICQELDIIPCTEKNKTHYAYCEIGPQDRRFGVKLETNNGDISPHSQQLAQEIISQIVELDTQARANNNTKQDYEEELAYVDIAHDVIELHYYATTVNTAWGAYFTKRTNGEWVYEGLG